MLFTNFSFFVLLVTTFSVYYFFKQKTIQLLILIVSSFVFYAYSNPILLLLLMITILINVIISYYTIIEFSASKKKTLTTVGVILNIIILLFFKYSGLLASVFLSSTNNPTYNFLVTIPLPIGISFYTFQGISLMLDTYNGKVNSYINKDNMNLKTYFLEVTFFKSFFPQLISGPIVKAHEFLPQIHVKYLKDIQWENVLKKIILGYFLKMVVADNLKTETFWLTYPYFLGFSTFELLVLLVGYSIQIFADFAGYSLIALGLAKLFGYDLIENFNFPYISKSFAEFWQRWHISLSTFLKQYLYIPLGGNRNGKIRTYFNLIIVMVIGGFWHGATISYAIWGLYHGLLLAIERLLTFNYLINPLLLRFYGYFKMIFVFSVVTIGWLLFKLPHFDHVIYFVKALLNNNMSNVNYFRITNIIMFSSFIVMYHLMYKLVDKKNFSENIRLVIYGILLFLILFNSGSSSEFIYFQF